MTLEAVEKVLDGSPETPETEQQNASEHTESTGDFRATAMKQTRRRSSLALQHDANDVSFHPGSHLEFYCPPQQRQKWGDSQVLPRTNWGDTFYDLFFVAGAYSVGNILLNDPNGKGLLYFSGTFFPLMDWWRTKTMYDSRYVVGDDIAHRLFEGLMFVLVGTGVLHIGTVDIMSNPRAHIDMFIFALIISISNLLKFMGYAEISFLAKGQREILRQVGKRDAKTAIIPFGLSLAATIIAGVEYFRNGMGSSSYSASYGAADDYSKNETAAAHDDDHRFLAGDESESSSAYGADSYVNNLPITLCLLSFCWVVLYFKIAVIFLFPNDGSHKNYTVPLNVNFNIHRDGEWIMLLLGESILSLLIVDVTEAQEYYATFFCGILTVILLQYLHYRSLPHDADEHALRRDKNAAVWWSSANAIYSASLVCVGVSYKLFLYEFTFSSRRLEEETADGRWLAGGPSGLAYMDTEARQQASANLFSGAMAIAFFSLDSMILLHSGLKNACKRLECQKTKKRNVMGLALTVCRMGLIVFFATLSQYENDPNHLSVLGMAGVVAQLLIRRIGMIVFPRHTYEHILNPDLSEEDDNDEDPEENKWPNTTHAAIDGN